MIIPPTSTIISPSSPSPGPSPRPSISSSSNYSIGIPLTPIEELGLDKMSSDLIISTEDVDNDDPLVQVESIKTISGRPNLPTLNVPPPSFSNYSFGISSSPSASSSSSIARGEGGRTPSPLSSIEDGEIALPSEGFKFGSCPSSSFVGTPTAEQGPFEYPSSSSSTSNFSISPPKSMGSPTLARRGSLALGLTHRRGSIIPQPNPNPNINRLRGSFDDGISPPPTRRSSTCSTLTTLPIAGRRPSIVHSTTVEVTLPQAHPSVPPFGEHPPQPSSASSSRRPSVLMFPSKPLPAPIPPSLLARRGSLPVAQLFGVPLADQNNNKTRSSYSSGSATISTAQLYLRRQSVMSESGFSNGSGTTIGEATGNEHYGYNDVENGYRRRSMRPRTPSADFTPQTVSSQRRGSVSFFPPVPVSTTTTTTQQIRKNPNFTPNRSSSISSRSSIASSASASSQRSSISSSRIPINFSPRHPTSYTNSFAYPSRQTSVSTTNTTISTSTNGSNSSPSLPSSPRFSINAHSGYIVKRNRHSTSKSSNSNPSLGSGSSEGDRDHEDEILPTPNQSKINTVVAPTFSDPWSTTTNTTSIENKIDELSFCDDGGLRGNIPLETPPLETVLERPPLESVDSGATERP
ncbi:uncharacterized protein L201_000724 [Kwoniella dendrophila CBS 6074]|uniref:Uncharacterized protein n=1 Tax=Kwoniella dendrophila CBS 6074 TaxID=1295534 RepID=A0AAX4JM35_9TREE